LLPDSAATPVTAAPIEATTTCSLDPTRNMPRGASEFARPIQAWHIGPSSVLKRSQKLTRSHQGKKR
jgi:hypothetical protein